MKKINIYCIFLLCSSVVFPQKSIDQIRFSQDSLRFFVSSSNKLLLFFESSVVSVNGLQSTIAPFIISEDSFKKELKYNNFEVVKDSVESLFFVRRQLGEVFSFKQNRFSREDFSFFLKSNAGSTKAFYNSSIYSFFGYGYFKENNLIVSFDFKTKEWNKVNPILDSDIPPPRRYAISKKIGQQIYFLGGIYSINNEFLDDVFVYNFELKSFKKIGTHGLTSELDPYLNKIVHLDQNRVLIFQKNSTLLLDFKNFTFDKTTPVDSDKLKFFEYFENEIYYLDFKTNSEFEVAALGLEKILSNFNNPQPLLKKQFFNAQNSVYLLLFFILLSLGYVFFKLIQLRDFKTKNILKQSNYITFNNFVLPLTYEESEIVDFLLLNKKVPLSEILNLNCFEEYSDSYKKIYVPKILVELIEKVNTNTDKNFKLSIEKEQSKEDKRVQTVYLRGTVLPYGGWISYIFNF